MTTLTHARTPGHKPGLDGVRALAVLAVVARHSGVGIGRGGLIGVDIFFVLSGLLITTLLIREHSAAGQISIRAFYARRALRLAPALMAMVLAVSCISFIAHAHLPVGFAPSTVLPGGLLAGTYTSDIGLGWFGVALGPFGHTWSLAVEEHFYLIWPLILVRLIKRGMSRTRMLALTVGAVALIALWRLGWWIATGDVLHQSFSFDTRGDELLAGCALAFAIPMLKQHPDWMRVSGIIGAAVLIALFVAAPGDEFAAFGGYLVVSTAAAMFLAWVWLLPDDRLLQPLSWRPMPYLGRLSYSLYLWHFPIFWAGDLGLGHAASVVLRLGLTLVVATASYHIVERPALRLKDRVFARPRTDEDAMTGAITPPTDRV